MKSIDIQSYIICKVNLGNNVLDLQLKHDILFKPIIFYIDHLNINNCNLPILTFFWIHFEFWQLTIPNVFLLIILLRTEI